MRDPRRRTVAALTALSSLAILVSSLAVGLPDEPVGPKTRPIKILASPSILPPGTPCRIEVDDQPPTVYRTVVTTYEGTVVEADDEGIRLDVREVRRETAVPAVSRIPFSDRLFRNVGNGRPAPDAKCLNWSGIVTGGVFGHQRPIDGTIAPRLRG